MLEDGGGVRIVNIVHKLMMDIIYFNHKSTIDVVNLEHTLTIMSLIFHAKIHVINVEPRLTIEYF